MSDTTMQHLDLDDHDAVVRWLRSGGLRAGWDDTKPLAAGALVYYEDRAGNRLSCRVERSGRVGHDDANGLATMLVAVRWLPAARPDGVPPLAVQA